VSATVEWVETTGRTVEAAKEAALDRLGVDEQDAEFEVIEEPRSGLFGRTRGEGRVRARVIPRSPRPKPERRRRSRNDKRGRGGEGERPGNKDAGNKDAANKDAGNGNADAGAHSVTDADARSDVAAGTAAPAQRSRSGQRNRGSQGGRGENRSERSRDGRPSGNDKEREVMESAAQCEVVTSFLDGLGEAFGLEITTSATLEDGVLAASIDGSEVGLFIGPGLGTLEAIQEIARNVLQRHADGREYAKVVLDVTGVREQRRSKLVEFVTDAAQQVLDDDVEVAFEVMSSLDRKIVHDTVAEIDGVASSSIGEDPRRRVVLKPT